MGFSAKRTGVGCHFLQGIFPSQGWNHSPFALQADSLLMNHHGSPFPTIKRPLNYCGLHSVLFSFFRLSSFSPLPSFLSCNISCSVSWIFLLSFMSNYLYLKLSYKRYLKQTVVHLICLLPSSHSSFQSWRNLQEMSHNLEGWDGVGGGREVPEGGDVCIPMVDSCWCMAETSTTL